MINWSFTPAPVRASINTAAKKPTIAHRALFSSTFFRNAMLTASVSFGVIVSSLSSIVAMEGSIWSPAAASVAENSVARCAPSSAASFPARSASARARSVDASNPKNRWYRRRCLSLTSFAANCLNVTKHPVKELPRRNAMKN